MGKEERMSGKRKVFALLCVLLALAVSGGCKNKADNASGQPQAVLGENAEDAVKENEAAAREDVTEEIPEEKDAWAADDSSFQGNKDGNPDGSYFEGEGMKIEESGNEGEEGAGSEESGNEEETETAGEEEGTVETETAAAEGTNEDSEKQVAKKLIVIDPGHQAQGNSEQEPIAPGETQTKAKVSSGTCGVASGVPEYQLNLVISRKLKKELENRGYEIIMTRESHEVDISNSERAMVANGENSLGKKADAFVRIHANGAADSSVSGVLTIEPTQANPYLEDEVIKKSRSLSEQVYNAMLAVTGAGGSGSYVWETDTMSGINWSEVPVTIVELGYMTNPEEDQKMMTKAYQKLLVQGIADGIDDFFQDEGV